MLLLVLLACRNAPDPPVPDLDVPGDTGRPADTSPIDDTAPVHDTAPVDDTADTRDTHDTAPDAVEICDDGVDNDVDGLVDCEDPDCVEACTEAICDDGVDNDGDGDTDCADDDCWGLGDCVLQTQARVVSGQRVASGREHFWGSRSDTYTVVENTQQLDSLVGQVRVNRGSGWTTCSWTGRADAAWRWQMSDNVDVYFGSHALSWESVTVGSACADHVQTSTFLPTILNGDDAIRYTSNGTSWYSPAPAGFLVGGAVTWTWATTSRWGTSFSPSVQYTYSWRSQGALSTGAWFTPVSD